MLLDAAGADACSPLAAGTSRPSSSTTTFFSSLLPQTNLGLEELLVKEETIFQALGVLKQKPGEYKANLATLCPASADHAAFPDVSERASSQSSAEMGMQLRGVAILIVNGVAPRLFQVQQTLFDTHSNQGARLQTLLPDLRTAVFTCIKAAENCGF